VTEAEPRGVRPPRLAAGPPEVRGVPVPPPHAGQQSEAPAGAIERFWAALAEVQDPEIPVSLVDMGLIVSIDHEPASRAVRLRLTYTAMGCPAMDMIQDDIRARLLQEPDVDTVEIDVVWDPVWTSRRLSPSARRTMRDLGLAV
jgi:metal-sulfur cluster biosynthetic enzyme